MSAAEIKPQAPAAAPKAYGIVDLVICLDTTGSMTGIIEEVIDNIATHLIGQIDSEMAGSQIKFDWRGKIIGFGDLDDGEAMYQSEFVDNDSTKLTGLIKSIPRTGGGDLPESSLDAIYVAAQSDWRPSPVHKVVACFTDAPPKAEMHSSTVPAGPRDMTALTEKLTDERIKLFLFAPDDATYGKFNLVPKSSVQLYPEAEVYDKLKGVGFDEIFKQMAATISRASTELAMMGGALPSKSL